MVKNSEVCSTILARTPSCPPLQLPAEPSSVRSDHMVLPACIGHIRAETLQQRIRHTGEELHARRLQLINKPFCHPFAKTGLTGSLTFCHKVLTRRCHLQNRCEGVSVSAARVFGQSFPRLAQPESNVARDWQDSSSVRPARDSRPAP